MGNVRVTTKNLEVVQIDTEKDLLLIKGAVPGAPGGDVIVKPVIASEVNLPSDEEPMTEDVPQEEAEQDAAENTESQ